ncbi:glycine--tRNA ligase [Planomonospora sphaerica]|uniref:Glycine--tRNA ligase n=1 Tax=Planomonospora sphaerica TaxID=161355 RepID=A0A161LBE2_9ACTN|nr:DALR anticodon-binding domain-containing protein [Planomonospora sphaerica]GAT65394.1 glycine--tRNA ligase [Planomonospora sphaerica]
MTPGRLAEVLGAPPVPRGTWEREALYVSTAALRHGERAGERAAELALRLRALPGIEEVRVRPGGFLEIVVAVPGELVGEAGAALPGAAPPGGVLPDQALPGAVLPDQPLPDRVLSGAALPDPVLPDPVLPGAGRSGDAAEGRGAPGPPEPRGPSPWPQGTPWSPGTWDNPGFVVGYAHARAVAVRRWAAELGVAGAFRPELLADRWDRAVLRALAEAPGRRVSRDPGWAAYAERLALAYHDAFERAPALPRGDEAVSALHVARVRLAGAVREVLAEAMAEVGVIPPDRL